ncbi:MAG TPA: hypothetical protein PLH67_14755, partial [Lentisphaeria bacterium]|nr:hypothetical protein [Lentisphaeria bacterium]
METGSQLVPSPADRCSAMNAGVVQVSSSPYPDYHPLWELPMTKLFFPALRRCRLVAVLSLLTAVASGQPDQAGPSAVLIPGMTVLPEPTLVMIDGRENEIFTRR